GSEIFTLPTALAVAHRLADLGVTWFEEPLLQGARAGITELARSSPVSLAYGEHLFGVGDAVELVEHGHIGVLQPDAATCGGIDEARAMATVGIAAGLRVVPHVAAGPVSLAANLHLAASVPGIRAVEYPYPLADAWAALGTGPGLGPDVLVDG